MLPSTELWDSFWAIHAARGDVFHELLWRIRFLFCCDYARHIARYTTRLSSANLLEVGCGSARTLHYLKAQYETSRCYALDLSPQAIKVVRQISPTFQVGIASALDLPVDTGKFDVCFSIGLIEHFTREQARNILSEKIRITQSGGTVGIVVPWQSSIYNLVIRKAFGKHWPFGDENPFRRQELEKFMESLGLRDIKIHVIYGSSLLGIGRKEI